MTAIGACSDCGELIHALDGATWTAGQGGWRHGSRELCARAAEIDYAAAFDELHKLAISARGSAWRLVSDDADDDDPRRALAIQLDAAVSWSSFELPSAVAEQAAQPTQRA